MVLLLALDNLGVQIKPLLAGLGIGGIAVALAVQTVLGDLLASMSIALDKPFGVGDLLTVGDYQGTVEHIGVKSTRLRSISGEQIIIANADIAEDPRAQLRPHARAAHRLPVRRQLRHVAGALAAIPGEVQKIVEAQPDTRFDRCHFLAFGDTALQFELVLLSDQAGIRGLRRCAAGDQPGADAPVAGDGRAACGADAGQSCT